jgi:ML-like domain
MRIRSWSTWPSVALVALGLLPSRILAGNVLQTSGYSLCSANATVQVQKFNISYDRDTQQVTFDVAGTSTQVQNVTASLIVYAYGNQVYQKSFDPCASDSYVSQLCPGGSRYLNSLISH